MIHERRRAMKQTVYFPILRYMDQDGKPTCIEDLSNGDKCEFLQRSYFGQQYHCFWDKSNPTSPHSPDILARGDDGRGSLIPVEDCPLWEGVER